ncbi:MAG TPA: acyloxyacyl hydrolase [Casimicrobiaceae bacterium]
MLLGLASETAAADASAPIDEHPRLSLTGGWGNGVAVFGVGGLWPLAWKRDELARHGLDAEIGADLLRWDGRDAGEGFLWDVGVTPYLRWRPDADAWHHTFVRLGIGVHLLSHTKIGDSRDLGSAFQFGERLAWGFNFGAGNRYEMTLLVQHVSNGRIKEPNDGLTYFGATLGIPVD